MVRSHASDFSDAGTWKLPARSDTGWVRTAQYVSMRDGIKNATYLYLPKGLEEGEKIPAIIIPTPYFSMVTFRSPLCEKLAAKLAISGQGEWAEEFARFGYATVLWDLRGSGASYGRKLSIMMPDVVRDAVEILDWIVRQPWSNGRVGATGISARGMAAQWLLAARHPALKAIVPRFTVFDIYRATHIGGLKASRFIQDVGAMLRAMDANRMHEMSDSLPVRWLLRLLGMGIMPVDEDRDGTMLAEAVRDHRDNEYFDRDLMAVTYRDETLPNSSIPATLDAQSPFSHAHDMEVSGAAIYGYTGWYDGAFPTEMINLHMTVRTPGSKLMIGPWGHHARFYSSPAIEGKRATDFDQAAEIVRFFDYHLKGIRHGLSDEAPIRYFTMGEEKWKAADTWPPPGVENVQYYLSPGNVLRGDRPGAEETSDIYHVDFDAGTGVHSRFGKHLGGGRFPVRYPDRRTRDQKLLTYTSAPLDRDMEITGHPIVTLFVSSSDTDGAFIVYLEDVLPDGHVVVATDGCLRACFRKLSSAKPPYWQAGPYRTYNRADAMPLVPGEVAELTFDLSPISYLFKAGHSLRVALAGADKDNFAVVPPGKPPTVRFYRGGRHASRISLPVISK